jgi:hypothetical protein
LRRGGTAAGRLLFNLLRDASSGDGSTVSPAKSYMELAVYDLIGALFAWSDPRPVSPHTDKMFARIRSIINDGFADPDFGPCEVAAAAGISLRYVQKLLRSAVLLAVSSYIRFAWSTPRAFSIAGSCWAQTGLSAKSHMLAVFATIPILRENFAVGSGTRQAPTPEKMAEVLTTGQFTSVPVNRTSWAHDVAPRAR